MGQSVAVRMAFKREADLDAHLPPDPVTRACLVHSPCRDLRDDRLEPPLGMLYMAAYARRHGHDVEIVDLSSCEPDGLAERVPDGCAVYGFSTYSVNFGLTRELAGAVRRRNPSSLFVAGGPHATALPHEVADEGFDSVVTGEGELAFADVLSAVARREPVPCIVAGTPADPLDMLPSPAFDLVDLATYSREVDGHRCISVLTSRGCPYQCSFCNSNIMGAGKPIRCRSPSAVVNELRVLRDRYDTRHFRFQDDMFTINRKRIRELTEVLAPEGILYRCFSRVNTCSPEMAEMLRAGGCVHASFGVETGSPKLLDRHAMHKGQTPDQIRWALSNARAAGLRTRIFLIVGFPGETDETIAETLALVKGCPWDEFAVYPLIAYPGTPLHDRPHDFGITYIDTNYSDYVQVGANFKAGFTIRTAEFDEHQVRQWRDYMIEELLDDGRTWAGDSKGFK